MSWAHPLGTDHLGRDMPARLMLGAGHTAVVLTIVAAISFVLGTGAGVSAALLGGTTEVLALCVIEFVVMMPALILALTITALIGLNPVSAGIALGLSGAGPYALVAHGLTRRLLAMPFVRAAEALGASRLRIGLTHVLPNCLPIMRTYLASDAGRNMVHYSALAFLGIGADATSPDWGAMLFEYRMFIFDSPDLMLLPGAAITLTSMILMAVIEPRLDEIGRPSTGEGQPRRPDH
jgi:peptide/nickel transport system permease protein